MSSYLAYYQANAQSDLKSCQKLASVRLFKLDCICGAAATEWISDSWGAFASVPHLIYLTNVFVSRILIENQSISCMQFSRCNLWFEWTYLSRWFWLLKPVGLSGLEPPTSRLSGVRSNLLSYKPIYRSFLLNGDKEIRTLDPLLARQVLSQLSYIPI